MRDTGGSRGGCIDLVKGAGGGEGFRGAQNKKYMY
jgi:hypothetical protein